MCRAWSGQETILCVQFLSPEVCLGLDQEMGIECHAMDLSFYLLELTFYLLSTEAFKQRIQYRQTFIFYRLQWWECEMHRIKRLETDRKHADFSGC